MGRDHLEVAGGRAVVGRDSGVHAGDRPYQSSSSFDQMAALFKKRFDRVLTSEQAAELTYDAILMVWKQLDRLPTADVSETTTTGRINFIQGGAWLLLPETTWRGRQG